MEKRDTKILKLIETIESGDGLSQREMSNVLKLSLGSVNKLLKDLITQKILKTDKNDRNKVTYLLTSTGVAKKLQLKRKYLSHHVTCYIKMKKIVKYGLEKLLSVPTKRVLFYGAGELCEIACMLLAPYNYEKIIIIDDCKAGDKINGLYIHKESEMTDMLYDAVLIMSLEDSNIKRNKLIRKGIPSNKIFPIIS